MRHNEHSYFMWKWFHDFDTQEKHEHTHIHKNTHHKLNFKNYKHTTEKWKGNSWHLRKYLQTVFLSTVSDMYIRHFKLPQALLSVSFCFLLSLKPVFLINLMAFCVWPTKFNGQPIWEWGGCSSTAAWTVCQWLLINYRKERFEVPNLMQWQKLQCVMIPSTLWHLKERPHFQPFSPLSRTQNSLLPSAMCLKPLGNSFQFRDELPTVA